MTLLSLSLSHGLATMPLLRGGGAGGQRSEQAWCVSLQTTVLAAVPPYLHDTGPLPS